MTPEEAVAKLDALDGRDPENDHGLADIILLQLVPAEVRDAVLRAEDRAGGWWWS